MTDEASRTTAELLLAGRDREAARLGALEDGGTMETLTQLDTLGPLLAGVVGGITPDQLDRPTPCAKFTVRGVLEHMIGGATMFTAAYKGEAPGEPPLADPLGSFLPVLGDLAGAISAPGALDRTVAAPFGDVSGDLFARFVVLDGLVHGWDLASATGQPYDPPAPLVAEATALAEAMLDPMRDGDTFAAAAEPPAGATPIERLACLTGRSVPA